MEKNDTTILTAFALPPEAKWHVSLIVVIESQPDGMLTRNYIQQGEQTKEMKDLFEISAAVNAAMVKAVEPALSRKEKQCV